MGKKHHDSEDERGWDRLGRLNLAIGNEGIDGGTKQRACSYIYIVKRKLRLFG